MLFLCLLLLKNIPLKTHLEAGIESDLFLFIAILALQILGKNAVEKMHTEFENITLIQLFV